MNAQVRSSLPYQVLVHINKPYAVCFWVVLAAFYVYKGYVLPYPNHVRVLEFLILLFFIPIEAVRLSWAARGNLTETPAFVSLSLGLSIPSLLICIYLGIFQNYILLIEEVFICIEGALIILEVLFGIILVATLSRTAAMA
ncbi:unnamed protein product, partial [Mesorhabditis spiculigera]